MPAHVKSAALRGIEAIEVDVEVDVLTGLPSFTVVGLGDTAIKESRERLTAALSNIGYKPPRRKTIVSLAPASLKKEGSIYDVPITLGFLVASGQASVKDGVLEKAWCIGELGLDGSIRPVKGVLPIALEAARKGIKELYLPKGNKEEARAAADKVRIYPISSLSELVHCLQGKTANKIQPLSPAGQAKHGEIKPEIDFSEIKGQDHAKRALIIAASASHNVLLVGSPGTGKTLLARALAGILPPLLREESYAVTSLYSIAGLLPGDSGLINQRPFRNPHHGASSVALVGGGSMPKPGEVSLAHHGVLFLDELPEFSRHVLDQLRQPIEDGFITVSRSSVTVQFPARSILVGAMNPCKCGYLGSSQKECQCPPGDVLKYQRRVSGPLLDRFDIHIMVNDVSMDDLLAYGRQGMTSEEMAANARKARDIQMQRQGKGNAELTVREIREHCAIDEAGKNILRQAENRFHLSSRGVHRLLKVARSIADLEEAKNIHPGHLAEALQYREQLKTALPEFV